ncbi:hypothetical protein N8035_02475 [Algibacter sp.]|nr:hypothetical protein [Algibacter sp.]
MSYRQPKIVDDKSGQVLGQSIVQGAQNLAQGAMQMAQKNQLAIKEEKKEEEDLNVGLVNLAAQYNNDLQNAAKLTKEQLGKIKKDFGVSMEDIIKQGYEAQKAFLKDKSTTNREAVETNASRRTNINKWMVQTGSLVENVSTLAAQSTSDIETNVFFPSIKGDDGAAGREMANAFLNKKGYGYGHTADKNDKGVMTDYLIIEKDGKEIARYDETDMSTITKVWDVRKETSVQTVQNGAKKEFITNGVNGATINNSVKATDATKLNGEGNPTIIPAEIKTVNGNVVQRQELDPTAIANIVEAQVQIMRTNVNEMQSSEKGLTLTDFGITNEYAEISAATSINGGIGFDKNITLKMQDKLLAQKVEETVLKGINVTKEVIPGENGEPDTIRYYNDKVLGRDRKTNETSAGERQMAKDYNTVAANFDSTIDSYTAPDNDPSKKQTIAQKVIGGTGLGIGAVVFARNQNRTLDDVSVNSDGSLLLRWGPPNYGIVQPSQNPEKKEAKDAMLAGNPNKMITINPNRKPGVKEIKVRASILTPDLNSLSFDLTNKNQLRNLIQLTTSQDATGAEKLIKKYNLN